MSDAPLTLAGFELDDLALFKRSRTFLGGESPDYRSFYVGKDDVHGVLKYLLCRCTKSLKLNMFGYDDEELNGIIEGLINDHGVFVQGTLDRSQASGVHEKRILAGWDPATRSSFAIGESATHQISHTKGGVIDGLVAFEGSTNWSASGEGTIVDPAGTDVARKAQNNTLLVHVNPIEVEDFALELDQEHAVVLQQLAARAAG